MKLHELLSTVKFDYDTDVNTVILYIRFETAPVKSNSDIIVFSTELHKPWEMFKYLNNEVLDFKDSYKADPDFSSRTLEVWICL